MAGIAAGRFFTATSGEQYAENCAAGSMGL
jgi:hypothetical protein